MLDWQMREIEGLQEIPKKPSPVIRENDMNGKS